MLKASTFSLRDSPFMPPVVDQGDFLQTCVPCAVTNAIQYYDNKNNNTRPYRSRLYLYWYGRLGKVAPSVNGGMALADVGRSVANYGVSSEFLWPYPPTTKEQQAKYSVKPSTDAYKDAKLNQFVKFKVVATDLGTIKKILSVNKYPVICVIQIFPVKVAGSSPITSLEYAKASGDIPYPDPCCISGKRGTVKVDPSFKACSLQFGHCLLIVGWDEARKVFIVQNCYGTDWGDGGYGTISYSYILKANLTSTLYAMY